MKKTINLFIGIAIISCSGCNMFAKQAGYSIEFYDQGPQLVSSEYIEEVSKPLNQVLTAYVGHTVVDKKLYLKKTYTTEEIRASSDVVMNNPSYAIEFKMNEVKQVIGQTYLDDGPYMLVEADLKNYVVLVNRQGELYKKIGQLRNNRLQLVNSEYIVNPKSFRFEVINTSKSQQDRPKKGFDIKYEGINLDRIVFTYLDYSKMDGDRGYFENINFPKTQENIEIEGVGFKVLKATKDKLDYIILK